MASCGNFKKFDNVDLSIGKPNTRQTKDSARSVSSLFFVETYKCVKTANTIFV